MRSVSIPLTEIPAGFKAVRAGTGTDGTFKLVPASDPVVTQSALGDLEARFRLLLRHWVDEGLPPPPGLEREIEAAYGQSPTGADT